MRMCVTQHRYQLIEASEAIRNVHRGAQNGPTPGKLQKVGETGLKSSGTSLKKGEPREVQMVRSRGYPTPAVENSRVSLPKTPEGLRTHAARFSSFGKGKTCQSGVVGYG